MLQFLFRSGHSPLCGLAEVDDHDDKEDEEDVPTEAEEKQEPASSSTKRRTKTQLYAKYKGRGPHRMAYDFLHTDSLRQELTIICEIGGVLQSQYAMDLDSQKSETQQISLGCAESGLWLSQRNCRRDPAQTLQPRLPC